MNTPHSRGLVVNSARYIVFADGISERNVAGLVGACVEARGLALARSGVTFTGDKEQGNG